MIVNAMIARVTIIEFIAANYPDSPLLLQMTEETYTPVLSLSTVRSFLRRKLNWSVRRPTRAAQKLPENWTSLCEKNFFRIVFAVFKERIQESLIINADQTGIVLLPSGNQRTYDEKGTRQVNSIGHEEKRAFTLNISTALSGELLPAQSVWQGKTSASLPSLEEDKRRC